MRSVPRLADGSEYDIDGEWAQLSLFGAVSEALGEEISPATSSADLLRHAQQVGLQPHGDAARRGLPAGDGVRNAAERRDGNGIDRLLMALTGSGIRATILFPLVKPQ